MKLDQPRPLNADERLILQALLAPDFPGSSELRAQIQGAVVVGRCDCGCPTVDIEVSGSALRSSVAVRGRLAPCEGRVVPEADEPPGDIILFVDDGYLSCLEYVSYNDPSPTQWPPLERVEVSLVLKQAISAVRGPVWGPGSTRRGFNASLVVLTDDPDGNSTRRGRA